MKKISIIAILCVFKLVNAYAQEQGDQLNNKFSILEKINFKHLYKTTEGGVTIIHEFLTDKSGEKYGALFYIENNTDSYVNVQWQFVRDFNVKFGPAKSDITLVPPQKTLWITTVTAIDNKKDWSSGTPQYKVL